MLLGARQFFEKRGAPTPSGPTARDYVQNGLVAMWDGIENAGWGVHDAAATTWKDLVGINDITIVSGAQSFTDNSVVFSGSSTDGGKLAEEVSGIASIEFCGMVTHNAESAVFVPTTDTTAPTRGYWLLPIWYYNNSFGAGDRKSGYSVGANRPFTMYADYTNDKTDFSAKALDGIMATPTGASDYFSYISSPVGFSFRVNYYPFGGVVYNLRIYSRALTAAEIAANYAIDKARFNLP